MRIFVTSLLVVLSTFSFSQTKRVWEKIPNAPVITTENAKNYSSYENTPESVLNYFYASRIRKDGEWLKVFLPMEEWSARIANKVWKYDLWTITKFNLVSKTEYAPGKFWVKVNFEIVVDGKTDGGVDQAEVQFMNGQWIITSIPT